MYCTNLQFSQLIENSPGSAGVYKMFGTDGDLLYVGKAKNLRLRLGQYINASKLEKHKQIMRSLVARIEWERTETESDALVLEQRLIKTEKPKYNIMLTDGKMYPMLALTKHEFPRLLKFRGKLSQKKDVFGPYPSVGALNETIKMLQKVCSLRTCADSFMNNRTRPCLLHQIGRCSAPCMTCHSANRAYPAQSRGPASVELYTTMVCLARRILSGNIESVLRELSEQMQKASDSQKFENAAAIRDKISALSQTAAAGKRRVRVFDWIGAFKELEAWLGMKIERAAVFDNSHLFGKSAVGGMIVFDRNGFVKSQYKKFHTKNKNAAGNDIAMMKEFLTRGIVCPYDGESRLCNPFEGRELAKGKAIVIVDGGSAQWNIAHQILPNIPVLGIVKGEVRNGDEHFIKPDGTRDDSLPRDGKLFLLLRAARDEAHRFAIGFNRAARSREAFTSMLDEIEGIGPARKRALLHSFGSVSGIIAAPVSALEKVDGFSKALAKKIYLYFHPEAV